MQQHSRRNWIRRAANALIAALVFATGLIAVQVITEAPAAAAGPRQMTRTEIIERARYWVLTGTTYTQQASALEPPVTNETRQSYRRDCSGLVAMAWDLGTSPWTGDFIGSNPNWTTITKSQLQPGDAMVRHNHPNGLSNHIELFVGWVDPSTKKEAYVYSFNTEGQPVKHPNGTGGQLGKNNENEMNSYMKFIRRANVLDDSSHSDGNTICTYSAGSGAMIYAGPGFAYRGEPVSQGTTRLGGNNTRSNPWTATGSGSGTTITTSTWRRVFNGSGWMNTSQWAKLSNVPCAA